jgi:hypothetical protein
MHKRCAEEGCSKQAKRSTSGERVYCSAHMRAHGLQPASTMHRCCAEEGCSKQAKQSTSGERKYCSAHMRGYGQQPAGRPPPRCTHNGCTGVALHRSAVVRRGCALQFCSQHELKLARSFQHRRGLELGLGSVRQRA